MNTQTHKIQRTLQFYWDMFRVTFRLRLSTLRICNTRDMFKSRLRARVRNAGMIRHMLRFSCRIRTLAMVRSRDISSGVGLELGLRLWLWLGRYSRLGIFGYG